MATQAAREKFFRRVATGRGCWNWMGGKTAYGYGQIYADGKVVSTHRFSYSEYHGRIGRGVFICHRCDNPACVRPSHLFAGSAAKNNRDMKEKGRAAHGERNGAAKLTEAQVAQIVRDTRSQSELGRIYGVDRRNIARIKSGEKWSYLRLVV
jgi:hypothetical protein